MIKIDCVIRNGNCIYFFVVYDDEKNLNFFKIKFYVFDMV